MPNGPMEEVFSSTTLSGTFLIDAHVHCHDDTDPAAWLDHVVVNLEAAARDKDLVPAAGFLLFSEMPGDQVFTALRDELYAVPGWRLRPTEEAISLLATGRAGFPLILLAGRQIVTSEGLEVLALGASGPFAEGQSLAQTVSMVRAAGALAVVAWGFGKWWGKGGRVVAHYLDQSEPGTLFLGDNGGRLAMAPAPPQFATAARRGIFTLPGSDPLPLKVERTAVGRYGLVLEGVVDINHPGAGILRLLRGLERQPEAFGRCQGLAPFVMRQVAMQWRKRRRS